MIKRRRALACALARPRFATSFDPTRFAANLRNWKNGKHQQQ
jgi:hypothetical protein